MDYTKGAIDVSRAAFVEAFIDKFGVQSMSPTGAYFSTEHLLECLDDERFYALTLPNAKQFAFDFIVRRKWVKETRDCDNRAALAQGDMTEKGTELEWKANPGIVTLSYQSKTLGDGQGWNGYHKALAGLLWDTEKKDFLPMICDLDYEGAPTIWATPDQEVHRWVRFAGL